jgi:hypothetical protein
VDCSATGRQLHAETFIRTDKLTIKSKTKKRTRHITLIGESFKERFGMKTHGKMLFGLSRRKWEDNTKLDQSG